MTVQLDHLMVPSVNKLASAKLLVGLLGVPWSETGVGAGTASFNLAHFGCDTIGL